MSNFIIGTIVEAGTVEGVTRLIIETEPGELRKLKRLPFYRATKITIDEVPENEPERTSLGSLIDNQSPGMDKPTSTLDELARENKILREQRDMFRDALKALVDRLAKATGCEFQTAQRVLAGYGSKKGQS